jgi:hypothetical protein
MALYTYSHPKTGKTIDVQQSMAEKHVYVDEDGVEWNRVFYPVTFAFDTKIDGHDAKSFVRKTEKGGTIGDIMDLSREMSERRGGEANDEVKAKYEKDKKKKLNDRAVENLKQERKKQFEDFKKIDKFKVKVKKKIQVTREKSK